MNRKDFLRLAAMAGLAGVTNPLKAICDTEFKASLFGNDFAWGAATAAFQIEGAWNLDGKGPSIWDTFTHGKGHVKTGENADVACDFYHRYPEDLAMLKSLNLQHFRYSLAWSRILPQGIGKINEPGMDFYDRLTDHCLSKGITPWVTLYHWDLPQALEDKGGWVNRDIILWFREYCDKVTHKLGDRVKNWVILNEPCAFTGLGYMTGEHAPGKKGLGNYMAAVHHTAMALAEGVRSVREHVKDPNVGSAFSCSYVDPVKMKNRHEHAAARLDALLNRLFIEPALGMGYPVQTLPLLHHLEPYIKQGDEQKLPCDLDFLGVQNYFRIVGRFSLYPPLIWANQVNPEHLGNDLTEMGWEVNPSGMYKIIRQISRYPVKSIYITENGAAFEDKMVNGTIDDPQRKSYYQDYLKQVLRAKQEGAQVKGYFIWTLMDNFEWGEGYRPRFGLAYTDFDTLKRYPKNSALWLKEFLAK